MSATLTFASSGNGVKTGTAIADLINDLDTLVTSKAADATFFWETAGKNTAGTPFWYLMRRKSGAAGRLALIHWSGAPAGVNSTILDVTPSTTTLYAVWFPNGTGTTLSNLTGAGTICGNDTGACKASAMGTVSTLYGANFVPFYFDSSEMVVFAFAAPGSTSAYVGGGGACIVDAADVVYDASIGYGTGGAGPATFGSATSSMVWNATAPSAGSTTAAVKTNYGSANRTYYHAFAPAGSWANTVIGITDILTNTSVTQVGFVPVQLVGNTKIEGFVLRLRQIAFGPASLGAFSVYNITGPTVNARVVSNATAGGAGPMWLTNFKL